MDTQPRTGVGADVGSSSQTVVGPFVVRWKRATAVRQGNGVRSASPSAMQQLACEAGMYSLDAALQRKEPAGWFVLGQVFLRDARPAEDLEVVLHVDDRAVESTRTDAFGEFAFTSRAARRVGVALLGSEVEHIELWNEA